MKYTVFVYSTYPLSVTNVIDFSSAPINVHISAFIVARLAEVKRYQISCLVHIRAYFFFAGNDNLPRRLLSTACWRIVANAMS